MTLDIAMGGSTNTILHLLAAAQEAEVDFTMADIDRLSREVPQLCKVAPNTQKYHIEDVHRAGGIMAILGELDRAGVLDTSVPTVYGDSLKDALDEWDIMRSPSSEVVEFFKAGPGAFRPKPHSPRAPVGQAWMATVPPAVSATWSTPSPVRAASPCSTATSPWMAVWSRPPV